MDNVETKKRYEAAIFDFDGTVVDSYLGIVRCAAYALKEEFGIITEDLDSLRHFAGPPLHDSFSKTRGLTSDDAEKAVKRFRSRYAVEGVRETELYDGMGEMLNRLRNSGVKTAIASSKAEDMVLKTLDILSIADLFDAVVGVEDVINHASKADNIEKAVALLNVSKEEAVMVGDRCFDAEGAEIVGVDFIAALYAGYGEEKEFDGYPAVFRAKTPAEIGAFILGEPV